MQGIKSVRINGQSFRIKKLNPLLDFAADEIPQIFSYYVKRRPADQTQITPEMVRRGIDDMKRTVKAAVVDPRLCPEVLTVDDIFRWGDTGAKLYMEIVAHSLNQFRGLKGVFFSIKIRRSLYTLWRSNTADLQSSFFSPTETTP